QPPQLKPITIVATAPAAAPCIRRFSDTPWRIEGTCMALPFDKRDARRKQRAEVRKRQILTAPARTAALFGVLLCLPTAPALPLKETGRNRPHHALVLKIAAPRAVPEAQKAQI